MSSKGQVVIPAELRRKYRLEEGVTVVFREENGHIVLEPDRFAALLALRGSIPFDLEGALIEEKKREREYEDRER
jgi:AbrB family looped-hinge helix DNA binding protein